MTLSTRADHELARDVDIAEDGVRDHVHPYAAAEDRVMELEGTEGDPAVVENPHDVARDVADEVRGEAEDWAGCYADGRSVAELLGERLGNEAYDATRELLRDAPTVTVPEGSQ